MFDQLLQQFANTTWVEWLGMVTGIVGVWCSIKEKLVTWPLFITCYSSYTYFGYQFGLKAFVVMNVIFIGISIYGWMKWSAPKDPSKPPLLPSRTMRRHWPLVGLFLLIGTLAGGLLLNLLDHAQLPFLDAFATCCALTAQWMLSRKQIETWFFWIVSDIIYLGIFISGQSWPSVILFTTFIGLAIKGWKEWQRQLA